jgi:hypothetical protein
MGDTVDVDNLLSHRHDSVSDSSVAQHQVFVLDDHKDLPEQVLLNVVHGCVCWDGVLTMCVDSPSTRFNFERIRELGIEHLVVNWWNAGLGTVSICLICVALVLSR